MPAALRSCALAENKVKQEISVISTILFKYQILASTIITDFEKIAKSLPHLNNKLIKLRVELS
jgi:hypothetical protein